MNKVFSEDLAGVKATKTLCNTIDTRVLRMFKTKNKKPIKQENLRAQVIRAMKRSMRQAEDEDSNQVSKKIHNFNYDNEHAKKIWGILKSLIAKYPGLRTISSTEEGPNTDGKTKLNKRLGFKSFNKEFCRHFFERDEVREYFSYYVELVFAEFKPKKLCEKFDIFCCEKICGKEKHDRYCYFKWDIFKEYLSYQFIKELQLDPVEQNEVISLPDVDDLIICFT